MRTCEREGWSIPFAQLTMHRAEGNAPQGAARTLPVPARTIGVVDVDLGVAASNDVAAGHRRASAANAAR